MLNSFIKFQLVDLHKIQALVFTDVPRPNCYKFTLFKEGEKPCNLKVTKSTSVNSISLFDLELDTPYEFGKEYSITLSNFNAQPVDLSDAVYIHEFDKMFNYDGDDLGSTYHKDHTSFALWAPLATKVYLKIDNNDGKGFVKHQMFRTQKGVYRLDLEGDYLNARYNYLVRVNGSYQEATDPYGKGASENSHHSGVVDIEAIRNMGKVTPTNKIENYVDAVIYEVGVRDFTEQNSGSTDIENKGKYLGFVEPNRKTKGGNPAGLDYLSMLGITHVQLNPIIDFGSVDDLNVSTKYNWGYDPISMFALEGSYSLHPEIPQVRLEEFKIMVNKLHERNIRVIVDVVYNHIYEYLSSCYEKIVPNYFFRRRHDQLISNASGCGDDVASEKYMVRKMIVDSMKYFIDVFDIDGYRFDLMGLLDITTMKAGYKSCFNIKEDIMMYGEGWNMGMELPYEEKACSDNADKLPHFGFFNDGTRDIIKGPTFRDQITQKGYVNGDINYAYGLKYILYGSCLPVNYDPRYKDANQSINYIECHDNNTLFDKLSYSNSDEDDEIKLKRVMLGNGIIGTIFGVSFYHMGQEIGLSKKGHDNTYNVLDINKMDWNLVDERFNMVKAFKDIITLRKMYPLFHLHKPSDLKNAIITEEFDKLFIFNCHKKELINGAEALKIIYNPNNETINYNFDGDYSLVYSSNSGLLLDHDIKVERPLITPVSISIFAKR